MRIFILATAFLPFLVGCPGGGGGGSQSSVPTQTVQAPGGLTFSQQNATYALGQIVSNSPSLTLGQADQFSIDPPLPSGLVFNTSSGTISGTPTQISAATTYTVSASNSAGSTSTSISITINDIAPNSLSYGQSTSTYLVGSAISANNPTNAGGTITSYSVIPPLPTGLSLSPSTGAITGTPSGISATTSYTITGSNSGGSTSTTISITVNAPPTVLISPTYKSLLVGESFQFAAQFGLASYSYSIASGVGSINSSTGNYTSPVAGDSVVRVTDAIPSISDAKVKVVSNPPFVATGTNHGCAIFDGALSCWGRNNTLQLGVSQAVTTASSTPLPVPGLSSGVTDVAAGYEHTCVVQNGAAKCFGRNTHGALGNGTTTTGLLAQVSGLTTGVTQVAAGAYHSCALMNGGVWCWGYNNTLGNGSVNTHALTPVSVTGLTSGVTKISAGGFHTCAITSTGAAKCWGLNTNGQLGDNSNTVKYAPVDVVGLGSGVTHISAAGEDGGGFTTCAVHNGAAKCWGENGKYQLGNGTANDSYVPVQVTGLTSGVADIQAGHFHSCALLTDQTAKCWGTYISNAGGGTTARTTPSFVRNSTDSSNASNISQITTKGPFSTCLVVSAEVSCFGEGFYGRLGTGVETDSPFPTKILFPNLTGWEFCYHLHC